MKSAPVVVRPRRPRALVEAIRLMREARVQLISVYRITEAAELDAILKRLENR